MITFKKVRWKNLMSFGNAWTEISLNDSKTTLILGENGNGKSSINEAICFALFGKPFRKINKPQLVNSINAREMVTEIEFSIGNKEYLVVRGMKPNRFEIYCNGALLKQDAAAKDYQDFLEKNILKMNYNSFTQIVMLGSASFVPFMRLPAASRREIIEDLLDIKIFSVMNVLLKERISDNKQTLADIANSLDLLEEKKRMYEKHLQDIQRSQQKRLQNFDVEIQKTERAINCFEIELDKIENDISGLLNTIRDYDSNNQKKRKLEDFGRKLDQKTKAVEKARWFYGSHNTCPTCSQEISDETKQAKLNEANARMDKISTAMEKLSVETDAVSKRIGEIEQICKDIDVLRKKGTDVKSSLTSSKKYLKSIQAQREKETVGNISEEKKKISDIDNRVRKQYNLKEESLNKKEVLLLAAEMLRDRGIKTTIVKQYIPIMNRLINKYLSAMDFFVNFELDENFNETIRSRHRDVFSYSSFSEGEKLRIDLALLLTWRSIAKMKNSTNTNLLLLDEVFDASLDVNGCDDFLRLLEELSNSGGMNIFIISHKGEIIQDKFDTVIKLEKVKNFSRIVMKE